MKRIILVLSLLVLALIIAWGDGTVRIYTGNGTWCYKDCNDLAVDCPGAPFVPAVNVVQYGWAGNPWDNWNNLISPPRPWQKLYEQSPRADGFWIGMRNDGWDIVPPAGMDTLWFYSPGFMLYDNISRAAIWLSADDIIDIALLRDMNTGTSYAMPCVPVNSYGSFFRFDLTDFFRSITPSPQGFRMEFRVRNTAPAYVGMIGYMSYDYGTARNYAYSLSGIGQRFVSMPFKPTNSAATLSSLFPGVVLAHYYNWQTASWQSLSISSPLTGSLGDITRTYTLRLHYLSSGSHNTTISGYPIFEQRYLDITTNNNLYFGTINCDCPPGQYGYVPFSNSNPDDMWPDKITGTTNWSYYNVSGSSPIFYTPIDEVLPKKAYYVVPHPSCGTCGNPCLPYHLDVINYGCKYPSMASSGEEYYSTSDDFMVESEPITFVPTEADLALIRWIEDSVAPYVHIPDSAEMCARFPNLCEERGFHKSAQRQVQKPVLSISAYPSPFNSELTINLSIPNDDRLTIGIYDISGNLVRTLYIGEAQIGDRSWTWNGLDDSGNQLPSGNYIVRAATTAETALIGVTMIK